MRKKTRILHVLTGLSGGGAGAILYGYYKCLQSKCDSDFVVMYSPHKGTIEENIISNGDHIFYIPSRKENYLLYIKKLVSIIRKGEYDIVYSHLGYNSFLPLVIAKLCGVRIRVAHSHTADNPLGAFKKVYKGLETFLTKIVSTRLCACGIESAKWTWGEKNLRKIKIVNNAIEANRFRFNIDQRNRIRSELQVADDVVMCCCVARFTPGKNHLFLIDTFETILKNDINYKLFLFGLGELEEKMKALVKERKLDHNIFFMGNVDNVNEYYNAFDLFLLPSKFEGVPVTVIESQTNGLNAIISDCISSEVAVTDLVQMLPLKQNVWVNAITNLRQQKCGKRENYVEIMRTKGFDVCQEANVLANEFAEILRM